MLEVCINILDQWFFVLTIILLEYLMWVVEMKMVARAVREPYFVFCSKVILYFLQAIDRLRSVYLEWTSKHLLSSLLMIWYVKIS